jgi:hypothetical protein
VLVCTYHCGACHSHFASLEAFDLHRAGDYADARYCLDPDDEKTLSEAGRGPCRMYPKQSVDEATIWTSTRSVGRARQAFQRTPQRLAQSERAA